MHSGTLPLYETGPLHAEGTDHSDQSEGLSAASVGGGHRAAAQSGGGGGACLEGHSCHSADGSRRMGREMPPLTSSRPRSERNGGGGADSASWHAGKARLEPLSAPIPQSPQQLFEGASLSASIYPGTYSHDAAAAGAADVGPLSAAASKLALSTPGQRRARGFNTVGLHSVSATPSREDAGSFGGGDNADSVQATPASRATPTPDASYDLDRRPASRAGVRSGHASMRHGSVAGRSTRPASARSSTSGAAAAAGANSAGASGASAGVLGSRAHTSESRNEPRQAAAAAGSPESVPLPVESWEQDHASVTLFLKLEKFDPSSLMVQFQQHLVIVMAMVKGGPNPLLRMRPEHAVRVQGSKSRSQPGTGIHLVLQKRSPGTMWSSYGEML